MLPIWLGLMLVIVGLLYVVAQPIWRGRLSERRRTGAAVPPDATLEPRRPGAGLDLRANWPGIALMLVGGILLLLWGVL
jgi:hypothetical protein